MAHALLLTQNSPVSFLANPLRHKIARNRHTVVTLTSSIISPYISIEIIINHLFSTV